MLTMIMQIQTLFPLLYLVIAHYHQIIKLANKQVVSDKELACGTRSITGIMSAVKLRVDVLCSGLVSIEIIYCKTDLT